MTETIKRIVTSLENFNSSKAKKLTIEDTANKKTRMVSLRLESGKSFLFFVTAKNSIKQFNENNNFVYRNGTFDIRSN